MMGDDVGGIAVHIGARVAALAGAGEVLVSSTVKDLVAGSGLRFGDRGSQSLKRGFPANGTSTPWNGEHNRDFPALMTALGLGRVKTKSDLVVMPSGRQIFAFFALRTKIPGAVIPRRVFTQPGSFSTDAADHAGRFMSALLRKRPNFTIAEVP